MSDSAILQGYIALSLRDAPVATNHIYLQFILGGLCYRFTDNGILSRSVLQKKKEFFKSTKYFSVI